MCVQRITIIKNAEEFRKVYMEKGTNKVLRMAVVPGRVWGSNALDMAPSQRENIYEGDRPVQKKPSISLSLFLDWRLTTLRSSTNLARAATCFWAQAAWTRQWADYMREAWKSQVWEATSWTTVRRPAGAVFCEMKAPGLAVPCWQVLRLSHGRWNSMKDTCPEDIRRTPTRHATNAYWQKHG